MVLAKRTSLIDDEDVAVARPRLGDASDYSVKHQLEFQTLKRVHDSFAQGTEPGIRALRPLEHLSEYSTLVMEFVDGPSLRTLCAPTSAWQPSHRVALEEHFFNAGTWLRRYHEVPATEPVRRGTAAECRSAADAYLAYLDGRVTGAERLRSLVVAAMDVLDAALPTERMVLGHGDCAMRNFIVEPGGQVVGFDVLGRWRVPAWEDVAYFLLSLRLVGPRAVGGAVAYPPGTIGRWTSAFQRGYFHGSVPERPLAAYGVLILLDRWAASLNRGSRLAGGLGRLQQRLEQRLLAAEAKRLLGVLV